jgi:hypothetical protein
VIGAAADSGCEKELESARNYYGFANRLHSKCRLCCGQLCLGVPLFSQSALQGERVK